MERTQAVQLLHQLVAIPSLSGEEMTATHWLADQMAGLGYDRAYVDAAGNAVGEIGAEDAPHTVLLLGHIDTVPGGIPVRVEAGAQGDLLYGRGSVDAKGPLATFVAAVARLNPTIPARCGVRFVVVGAVEEEAATSKGARHIRDRFDGRQEPIPTACIIGEPSQAQRVTLGYKGRLLVEMEAAQPMAHTAGPDAGVATAAVDFWNWLWAYAQDFNRQQPRLFDQLLPSLRQLSTWTDDAMQDRVRAVSGIRLPLDFDVDGFASQLVHWAAQRVQAEEAEPAIALSSETDTAVTLTGPDASIRLRFSSYEPTWRSDRNNGLVRSFLAAIREKGDARASFVVKTGTSDMNVVGPAWGCPILAYGPGDSSLDHTPHEHVSLDEYWQAVQILQRALTHFAESL